MQEEEGQEPSQESTPAKPPQLLSIELRVLGALMEKQLTTPDHYPLTVNSLITACNQKSSRDPVTSYHQGEIIRALNELEEKHFVRKEYGSRSDKYSQPFIPHLGLGKKQQALLCVMMLRGPQTLSELNTRTQRMQQFSDKDELTHCLERLCERDVPLVMRLGHSPGQRGERFGHLFSGTPDMGHSTTTTPTSPVPMAEPPAMSSDDQNTLSLLESEVADLSRTVNELTRENAALKQHLSKLYELTGHPEPGETQS